MHNVGIFSTRKTGLGFIGIYSLQENGKLIWSRSTGIHRLTRKDAMHDAKREWIRLGGPLKPLSKAEGK